MENSHVLVWISQSFHSPSNTHKPGFAATRAASTRSEQTGPSRWSSQVWSQVVAAWISHSRTTESWLCPLTQLNLGHIYLILFWNYFNLSQWNTSENSEMWQVLFLFTWIMLKQLMHFFHFAELYTRCIFAYLSSNISYVLGKILDFKKTQNSKYRISAGGQGGKRL